MATLGNNRFKFLLSLVYLQDMCQAVKYAGVAQPLYMCQL